MHSLCRSLLCCVVWLPAAASAVADTMPVCPLRHAELARDVASAAPATGPAEPALKFRRDTVLDSLGHGRRIPLGGGETLECIYHPVTDALVGVAAPGVNSQLRNDAHGRLIGAEAADGAQLALGDYRAGRPGRLIGTPAQGGPSNVFVLSYDAAGRMVAITLRGSGRVAVRQDDAGHLTLRANAASNRDAAVLALFKEASAALRFTDTPFGRH